MIFYLILFLLNKMSYINSSEFNNIINNTFNDEGNFIYKVLQFLKDNNINFIINDKSNYNKFEQEENIYININSNLYKISQEIIKNNNNYTFIPHINLFIYKNNKYITTFEEISFYFLKRYKK